MTHPFFFTWTAQKDARPLAITGGKGAFFHTDDGAAWLDLGALSYQANLGHGHPKVIEAIRDQASRLALTLPSAVYPEKTRLSERLLELAPEGFGKVFFTLGGAEANENALKMARLYTGRFKAVSRYRSYHGATMGAVSLSGDWRRPPVEPGLPGVTHVLDCHCDACPFGHTLASCHTECATQFHDVLGREGNVGAVFLEPVPGANGVLVPPKTYWPTVREACDAHGALLVDDEVLTGFGRTGRWLAVEHFDTTPDLITMAKGLTAGYATLGAVLVHDRVAEHFDEAPLVAGLTGYAHPIAVAAALATLEAYDEEGLIERGAALEAPLRDGLMRVSEVAGDRGGAVRALGALAAVDLDLDEATWHRLAEGLARRHLFVHLYPRTGLLILSPPLVITDDELAEGLDGLVAAVTDAVSG